MKHLKILNTVMFSLMFSLFVYGLGLAQTGADVTIDFGGPVAGQTGEQVTLEVTASDLTGLGVSNFDVEMEFDAQLIDFDPAGIQPGSLVNSVTSNVTSDGRVLVSFASSTPLSGSGSLFTLTGTLTGPGQNDAGLKVTELLIGDGSLVVEPGVPFSIAVDVSDTPPPPDTVQVDFGGPVAGQSGEQVSLEVTASDLTGLGVSNFDVEMEFDGQLIDFAPSGIQPGSLVNSVTGNVTSDGRVLVSFAGSSPLSGSGSLFTLTGTLTGPGQNDAGLKLTELLIGDGSLVVEPGVPFNIAVEVNQPSPDVPVLNAPANGVDTVKVDVQFEWNPSNGADTYRLQVASNPSFSTLLVDSLTSSTAINIFGIFESESTYYWRVNASNSSGESGWSPEWSFTTETATSINDLEIPESFTLQQNYPNPFNPATTISYQLPEAAVVNLSVFDLLGRKVSVLVNRNQPSGNYTVNFDASGLSSGIYIYRLQAGDFLQTRKMILMK